MRDFLKSSLGIILLLLLSALASAFIALLTKGWVNVTFEFLWKVLTTLALICMVKYLFKKKRILKRALAILKMLYIGALTKINHLFLKTSKRHGMRLNRYQDQVEILSADDLKHTKWNSFHSFRWRDMHTESDKVRYIYIRYIKKIIRKGFTFYPAETPNEINAILSHLEHLSNEKLFALYNRARYAKQSGITREEVRALLPSIGKKHWKV